MDLLSTTPSSPIELFVANTYIEFKADKMGYVAPGVSVAPFLRQYLQEREWVNKGDYRGVPTSGGYWVVTANYSCYNPETGMARIPRYALDALIAYLHGNVKLTPVAPVTPRSTTISMKRKFELREHQHDPVNFLTSKEPYLPLCLSTGSGKTTITIYAISQLGMPAIIILPTLISQWYRALRQFTTLTLKEIFVIKGIESLKTLWMGIERGYRPKIILASMRSLFMYAVDPKGPYADLPSYLEMQKALGLGIAVDDETHLWFYANVRLQLLTNVAHNIFLSATYARTGFKANSIFEMIFPPITRYGEQGIKRYTVVEFFKYHLGIPPEQSNKFVLMNYGYNHARYENYLLKHKQFLNHWMNSVLIPIVNMYFINIKTPGQRCLILNWTRKISEYICLILKNKYPNLRVTTYFSGKTKDSALDMDIIVSTHRSCGTGRDIKNLRTCINTVSFGSCPLAQQVMGRLREIPGVETVYADMWNGEVGAHYRHHLERTRAYQARAKAINHHEIN